MELNFKLCLFIFCGIPVVASFSWKNCGAPSDPIKVLSLEAYSNGTKVLYVTARTKLATNLTTPVWGSIDMQKKFFWGWTKIPCVDNVGSCNYEDLCTLSPYIETPCPKIFTKDGLPCKCPISQGQYAAKKFPIDLNILPQWIEEGNYRLKIKIGQKEKELICLLVYITF